MLLKLVLILLTAIIHVNAGFMEFPANQTELCPGIKKQWPWPNVVYHNETQKCYEPKTRGPCGTYMLFYQVEDSQYGSCSCISANSICDDDPKMNRPIARAKDGQCYPLFTKANCKDNEWFTVDKEWNGICSKNPCSNLTLPNVNRTLIERVLGYSDLLSRRSPPIDVDFWELNSPFWFLINGTCHSTLSRGSCKRKKVVYFEGTNPEPKCYNPKYPRSCPTSMSLSTALSCPEGMQKIGGDCRPISSVVFD